MSNSYCFKLIPNKNVMGHTYTCLEDDINLEAWQNISSATFFDIKIVPRFGIDVYKPILTKIKEIIKTKDCVVHFSNEFTDRWTTKHEKFFWQLLKRLEGEKFSLELQVRPLLAGHYDDLIKKIKNYASNNNILFCEFSISRTNFVEHTLYKND